MSRETVELSNSRRYSVQILCNGPPSSTWDAVKKRLCQVFIPVATKVHAAIHIHSRPTAVNLVIHQFGNTCNRCRPHLSDVSNNNHPLYQTLFQ